MGPQHPGVEFHTMWPPSATGPSIGTSGPSRPLVKVSTRTVWRASVVRGGDSMVAMGGLLLWVLVVVRRFASGDGEQQGDLLTVLEALPALGVHPTDHGQGRAQRRSQVRLGVSQPCEEIVYGR